MFEFITANIQNNRTDRSESENFLKKKQIAPQAELF